MPKHILFGVIYATSWRNQTIGQWLALDCVLRQPLRQHQQQQQLSSETAARFVRQKLEKARPLL